MMKTILAFFALNFMIINPACISQDMDYLIFPDPKNPVEIVVAMQSDNELVTGRKADYNMELHALIREELLNPFHRQMIRVSQCARNLAGNTDGPNLLLLSQNEGGFPRKGLILVSDGSEITYPDLHFVDLVIDQRRFEQGGLSIYTHELGHVMMELILTTFWDRFPNPTSPKQHVSMGVTDYLTAFYEGWGVSFQRLAYDNVEKYRNTFRDMMSPNRGLIMAWHSNLDEYQRLFRVEDNGYIYQKSPADPSVWDTLTPEQKILHEHTSTQFDITRIKTAQELLSCEGFMATFFYQINSNKALQESYLDYEFYNKFLLEPIPANSSPQEIFTPLENVLLKNLAVWDKMNISDDQNPAAIQYIQNWIKLFPDDASEIIKTFVLLSRGVTIDNELPGLVEKTNLSGQLGDINMFRAYAGMYMNKVQEIIKLALTDPSLLSAGIGPELWIEHPDLQVRRTLWMPEPKAPLTVNLNSAGFTEIAAFIGEEKAREFIEIRREKGYFESQDEIKARGFHFD